MSELARNMIESGLLHWASLPKSSNINWVQKYIDHSSRGTAFMQLRNELERWATREFHETDGLENA
jgi:hypothetical protein